MRLTIRILSTLLCLPLALLAAEAPKPANRCTTGSKLGRDGKVAESKTTFAPKDAIFLTIQAATAPKNKQVTIVVLDEHGEEMKTIWGDMKDGKALTAPLRNLPAGRYSANATVDKKQICQVSFEVQ